MPAIQPPRPAAMRAPRQRGFSLIELSVVLIVIGLIIGAAAIGRDLHRSAVYQRVSFDFVQGWITAYDSYVAVTGIVPGDNPAAPTGRVAAAGAELCGNALQNVFLAAGVRLPEGRTERQADRAAYWDSNGNPQELQVCLRNEAWAVPDAAVGTYVARPRNVLVLRGLVPSLATMLDSQIDGRADARFGRMREAAQAGAVATVVGQPWSADDRVPAGSTVPQARDESQVVVLEGLVEMSR